MTDINEDPFATAATVDDGDPFATSEDVKSGGVFIPRPPVDLLAERLIVMVPRKFDPEAKVSDYLRREYNLPEFREEWTIDLIVLDGGKLEYPYRSKVQGTEDEYEEKTMIVDEFPFTVPNFKVSWANIIGSLNKLAKSPRPFGLGRIRAGYSAADMRKGKTFEGFAAELAAWEEKVTKSPKTAGDRPKAKWHFVLDESPEAVAKARSWWAVAKAEGFKVTQ
jgi:hypothetical protein